MPRAKKHHYLPACYLFGFKNTDQRRAAKALGRSNRETQAWHCSLRTGEIQQRRVEITAAINNLYSEEKPGGRKESTIEPILADLEDKIAPILRKSESIRISDLLRSPSKGFNSTEIDLILEFVFQFMKRDPETIQRLTSMAQKSIDEDPEATGLSPRNIALRTLPRIGNDPSRSVFSELHRRQKVFLFTNPRRCAWITADRPLVRYNPNGSNGIALDTTEIYVPLSKSCLLWINSSNNPTTYRPASDSKMVRDTNRVIAFYAKRDLVGTSREQLQSLLSWSRKQH